MALERILIGAQNSKEIVDIVSSLMPAARIIARENAYETMVELMRAEGSGCKFSKVIVERDFEGGEGQGLDVLEYLHKNNLIVDKSNNGSFLLFNNPFSYKNDGEKAKEYEERVKKEANEKDRYKSKDKEIHVYDRGMFMYFMNNLRRKKLERKTELIKLSETEKAELQATQDAIQRTLQRVQKAKETESRPAVNEQEGILANMLKNLEVDSSRYLVLVSTSEEGFALSVDQVAELMSNNGISATVTSDTGIDSLRNRIGMADYNKVLIYGNFDTNGFVEDATEKLKKAGYSGHILQTRGPKDFSDAVRVLKNAQ
ncbi:hypothetical protein GF371_02070 [Candidatus Woesearchaeota archaeon]|nr:hypothetical protein [Candidatus Woesearchaeota archaeon]